MSPVSPQQARNNLSVPGPAVPGSITIKGAFVPSKTSPFANPTAGMHQKPFSAPQTAWSDPGETEQLVINTALDTLPRYPLLAPKKPNSPFRKESLASLGTPSQMFSTPWSLLGSGTNTPEARPSTVQVASPGSSTASFFPTTPQGHPIAFGFICETCTKPILGQTFTSMGKYYHPEHFRCQGTIKRATDVGEEEVFCARPLAMAVHYLRNGLVFCEKCFHDNFSPKCEFCKESIKDVSRACLIVSDA
jgi:hypothetical protein